MLTVSVTTELKLCKLRRPESVVGIATGYGVDDREIGV
jgi:hypothetical protein